MNEIIKFFRENKCKEETINSMIELFEFLEEREPKFPAFIDWLTIEMNKPDNLLIPKGLAIMLKRNFEDSFKEFVIKKQVMEFIERK